MRKIELLAACIFAVMAAPVQAQAVKGRPAASAPAAASTGTAAGSVVLVDELLQADNIAAREALRKMSLIATTGFSVALPAAPSAPFQPPPTSIRVAAIYGIANGARANVVVNGMPSTAGPGSVLGECRVEAIKDRCLTLTPTNPKSKPGRCASACWTGEANATPNFPMPPGVVNPMPLPSPLPRF